MKKKWMSIFKTSSLLLPLGLTLSCQRPPEASLLQGGGPTSGDTKCLLFGSSSGRGLPQRRRYEVLSYGCAGVQGVFVEKPELGWILFLGGDCPHSYSNQCSLYPC